MYWIFFLMILLLGHGAAFLFLLRDLYGFGGGDGKLLDESFVTASFYA